MMYAVICDPRSGSRSLAKQLAEETSNPIGFIHFAESVKSKCLTYEELTSQPWTLHGHWHTIHKLSDQHKKYIKENYTICEVTRDPLHRFLSSIITMATGNIDFKKDEIPELIDPNLVFDYFERMAPAEKNKLDWNVDICYNFDKLYNGSSLDKYTANRCCIKNYNELEVLYERMLGCINA